VVTIPIAVGEFFIWIFVLHLLYAAGRVSSSHIFFSNTLYCLGFPGGSDGNASACSAGDLGLFDPWVGNIPLEKEMVTYSSTLACEIPWTEEPGGLQSMGSQRVVHD